MQSEIYAFIVLVPDAPGEAIEFIVRNHALRLAFVSRDFVSRLPEQ